VTKEIARLIAGPAGSGRCSQLSPRSVERNSTCPATNTQTTLLAGALTWAKEGSEIDPGEMVGLAV
jgi:hypothetical protein